METIIEALRKVSLFSDFPEDAIQEISQKVESLSFPANKVLFNEGDEGDGMFFIVQGKISIYGKDAEGKDVLFGELKPGEYFGEMSLLDGKPRSAGAKTLTKTELLMLRRDDFSAVINHFPALALKLVNEFSSRLRDNVQILEAAIAESTEPLKINEPQTGTKVKVFISYSRRDKDFVRKLHEALVAHGFENWVDWEGIPLGTDWWQEIVEGIQDCDNFLFVISPDSVASKVCADEIQTALDNNKRLVPVLYREEKGTVGLVRAELQAINFTFMRTDEEFEQLLPELVATLSTDVDHIKTHTRLQNMALEWDRKKRSNSLVLRGEELENSENWLAHAAGKQPPPSELQGVFIQASRKDANRRQRQFLTGVVAALVISLVLAIVAGFSYVQAEANRKEAIAAQATAAVARDIAQQNEAFALVQRVTAEAASTKAIEEQARAIQEANVASTAEAKAIEQKNVADDLRGEAENQREIADAQRLASQAEGDLTRGDLLTRSVLLAINSMKISRNFQADLALRTGLDLLPTMLNRTDFESPIVKLVYSPNGAWLAIGEQNGHIEIWDSIYGNVVAQMSHDGPITDLAFNPHNTLLASASKDGTARVWNPETGEELYRLPHDGPVNAVAFSPNSSWLGTASDDQTARVWNMRTGRQISGIFHTGAVKDLDFSPGGSWVVSAGTDRAAILWVPTSGAKILTIYHENDVEIVRFGPTARWMVTIEKGGKVNVWNPSTGAKDAQMSHEQDVSAIDFSADGQYLVTASLDRTARVWETLTGRALTQLPHDRQILTVAFSTNGKWIATGSADNTARIWDPLTGREIARIEHDEDVTALAFTPNGLILTTGSKDQSVRVWSPEAVGQAVVSLKHPAAVIDLDFNPDETLLATAGADRTIRIWDVTTASTQLMIPVPSPLIDVDFSKDGKFIATGTQDGMARIWDAATGDEVASFVHAGAVLDVDFGNGDTWLVTGSADGAARIWNVPNQTLEQEFLTGGAIGEVSLHPDGVRLAAASLDETARIWNLETGKEVLRLEHPAGVFLVNFIAQSKWVITVSQDNAIRFWDETTGSLIHRFFLDSNIRAIEISRDGTKLAVTGEDNVARVWNISSTDNVLSQLEVSRVVHLGIINDVVFGKDDSQIATASDDRTVLVSLLIPQELIDKACSRLTRNLTQKEWTQFFEDDLYQLTCDNLPPDPEAIRTIRTQVGLLGAKGDYETAVLLMRHIQELDPSVELDIAAEIRSLTIEALLETGNTFANEGDFTDGYAIFLQLRTFDGYEGANRYPHFMAALCEAGGNEQSAALALPVCEGALSLNTDNMLLYEYRGIVKAWLGDFKGAIADFERVVAWKENDESIGEEEKKAFIEKRETWIRVLQSGVNPFVTAPPSS